MGEFPEAGGKKDPFHFSLRILTIAQGKDTCCKKRIPSPVPNQHSHTTPPYPPNPRETCNSAKNQFQNPAPGKELETAFSHPGSPLPPGQYCEAPSCSAWFPGSGPAVVGPGGPLRREGTKGIFGPTIHLSLPLFSLPPPSLPSPPLPLSPSAFLPLKALPAMDWVVGGPQSSPPALLALCLISDMTTVQCKLTKCF